MSDRDIKVAFLVMLGVLGLCAVSLAAEPKASEGQAQAPGQDSAVLYGVRLQSVSLAREKIAEAENKLPKAQTAVGQLFVYVSVLQDGRLVYVSPKMPLKKGELRADWEGKVGAYAGIVWDRDGHPVTVKVVLTTDATETAAKLGAIGAGGGAAAGALVGGVLAAVFTGGLGAPAGALIGAGIGAVAGGTAGATVGVLSKEDYVVMEKVFEKNTVFPLQGKLETTEKNSLGEQWTQSVSFVVTATKAPVKRGELELQQCYIVRVKEICLSEYAARKGEDDPAECRYYVELRQGRKGYEFCHSSSEYFSLDPGKPFNPEIYAVFLNTGEETEVRIYELDFLHDDIVFSSRVARLDGKAWVFQETTQASDTNDRGSYVVFETFGPLKK